MNTTPDRDTPCAHCGKPIHRRQGWQRLKIYCNTLCKQRAYTGSRKGRKTP